MRRALVAAFGLASTAACSYIFELPATSAPPTQTDASEDAVDADDGFVPDGPPLDVPADS